MIESTGYKPTIEQRRLAAIAKIERDIARLTELKDLLETTGPDADATDLGELLVFPIRKGGP